jgi:hypothetical protein
MPIEKVSLDDFADNHSKEMKGLYAPSLVAAR